jgi:hypothetical protein
MRYRPNSSVPWVATGACFGAALGIGLTAPAFSLGAAFGLGAGVVCGAVGGVAAYLIQGDQRLPAGIAIPLGIVFGASMGAICGALGAGASSAPLCLATHREFLAAANCVLGPSLPTTLSAIAGGVSGKIAKELSRIFL